MKIKVTYLYHSGFAVETPSHFLVLDYWRNTPRGGTLADGVISVEELKRHDNVVVLASHAHGDHFNREILSWREAVPGLRLILSDDIKAVPGATMVGAHETVREPDFTVETLRSNDEGVAFLLHIDGLCLYHAGDLNWWHWEGEPDDWNREMAERYKAEIARLQGKKIDLAFQPVDPRLGEQYGWGIRHLMEAAEVDRVVPMHFGEDTEVVDRLLHSPEAEAFRKRVVPLTRRGQQVEPEL